MFPYLPTHPLLTRVLTDRQRKHPITVLRRKGEGGREIHKLRSDEINFFDWNINLIIFAFWLTIALLNRLTLSSSLSTTTSMKQSYQRSSDSKVFYNYSRECDKFLLAHTDNRATVHFKIFSPNHSFVFIPFTTTAMELLECIRREYPTPKGIHEFANWVTRYRKGTLIPPTQMDNKKK